MTSPNPSSDERRQNRAEELFLDFLAEETSDDGVEGLIERHPELAGELRALAEAHDLASAALGDPDSADSASAWDAQVGERYEIRGEVARGGMGVILEVWDQQLRRHLAMKILRNQGTDLLHRRRRLSRLINEAQVLGQLDHPGIVPVHEIGRTPAGDLFFTMQLVRGVELGEIFERIRSGAPGWTSTRGVDILIKVAEAVAFAHSRGVVHRDLKPANVMVGPFGETYVMDWGLAKVAGRRSDLSALAFSQFDLDLSDEVTQHLASAPSVYTDRRQQSDRDPSSPELTFEGDIVGTPAYMSPEQAAGKVEQIDRRADIYATGAMLYHLLVGKAPYADVLRAAPSPEAVLQEVLNGAPTRIEKLAPRSPAELVAIATQAMARDPEARYGTEQELAEDLRAFLENRVVAAHRSGALAELAKWIRRNRGAAAAILVGLLSLIVLVVLLSAWNQSIREARDDIARQATALRKESYSNKVALASNAIKDGDLAHGRDLLAACEPELRSWEWHYLKKLSEQSEHIFDLGPDERVHTVAFSGDDRWFAAGTNRFRVVIWSRETHELLGTIELKSVVDCLDFAPDSNLLAVQCRDHRLRVFDVQDPSRPSLRFEQSVDTGFDWVRFSPSGERIAVGDFMGSLHIFRTEDGKIDKVYRTLGNRIRELAWSADGSKIFTASSNGVVSVNEIESEWRARYPAQHLGEVKSVASSPDGKWLATGGVDGRILIWDVEKRVLQQELGPRGEGRQVLSWSSDGLHLAAASGTLLRVWSAKAFRLSFEFRGHSLPLYSCVFSHDGKTLASASRDGTVRLWSLHRAELQLGQVAGRSHVTGMAFDSSESRLAVVTNTDHEVKIWGLPTQTLKDRITVPRLAAYSLAWTEDGRLVLGGADGGLRLLNVESHSIEWEIEAHQSRVIDVLVHPDQDRIVTIGYDSTLAVWDVSSQRLLWRRRGLESGTGWPQGVLSAVLLPDQEVLATGAGDGRIRFWHLRTGHALRTIRTSARVIDGLDVSSDGRHLLFGGWEPSELGLVDVKMGKVLWSKQSSFNYRFPKFSSNERRVFSGGAKGALGVWDAASGRRVVSLPTYGRSEVFQLDVTSGGLVVTGDQTGNLQFWGGANLGESRR